MNIFRVWALSLVVLLSGLSMAAPALAETYLRPVQGYTDLPGVKTQAEVDHANSVSCEQVLVRRSPRIDSGFATTNFCRRGDGPVFQSPQFPPSIIRQLRGFNY